MHRVPSLPAKTITAAVLSYDGRHLLEGLLPTLAAQTVEDLKIVVVDNGSSDGTVDWLAESWPEVSVVALADNVGVTAALNECVRAARSSDMIALLNNDTELEPNCLEILAGALLAHPEAGSAAPKLVDFYDRSVLDGAGDGFIWRGSATRRGHGEPDRGQYDEEEFVFGACGGAALYRAEAFEIVGEFDENYFAFYEDVDWNLRAQVAGLRCRYVPRAVVYHMGSATIGKGLGDFTQYHLWRNAVWLVLKDYPVSWLLRRAPDLMVGQALVLAGAWRTKQLRVWVRAMRDASRGAPRAVRARRGVMVTRRVRARDLSEVIETTRSELTRRYLGR